MGHVAHFKAGQHLFTCDVCGFVFHSEKKRKTWDGLVTCGTCWDPRHPQDFVRARFEDQTVEDARPNLGGVYLEPEDVTSDDLTTTRAPTAPTEPTFLNPGDVTADDL